MLKKLSKFLTAKRQTKIPKMKKRKKIQRKATVQFKLTQPRKSLNLRILTKNPEGHVTGAINVDTGSESLTVTILMIRKKENLTNHPIDMKMTREIENLKRKKTKKKRSLKKRKKSKKDKNKDSETTVRIVREKTPESG